MLLAYWKICSALAWEAVTEELPALTTRSGNNHEMARDDNPPYGYGTATNDERIFQAHDVSHTQHGRPRIDFKDEFGLVRQRLPPFQTTGRDALVPPTYGSDDEIINAAHDPGHEER